MKQDFILLLNLSESLPTKCVSLNNKPCLVRPNLIDLNPIALNYYPYIVGLDKCCEICNAVNKLSMKMRVFGKIKDVNVKLFNMITTTNAAGNVNAIQKVMPILQ